MTFRLIMHPASEGDALQLSWGRDRLSHALIDLGRARSYRSLAPLFRELGSLELLVITHIDADHIEGAVPLFREAVPPFTPKRMWFNAHCQLEGANMRLPTTAREILSPGQAEKVTAGIVKAHWPWNQEFATHIVSTDSPEAAQPIAIGDGLSVTLLSPSDKKLAALLPEWNKALAEAGMRTVDPEAVEVALTRGREAMGQSLNVEFLARPTSPDTTRPNGASISFIAEYDGRRVLMAADAHADILVDSLKRLGATEANPCRIDLFKVSHHGSKGNTSMQLLKLIDCTRFAFSTDGTRNGHPDSEAVARILINDPTRQKQLIFNFRQPSASRWDEARLKGKWRYDCVFPAAGSGGITIDV